MRQDLKASGSNARRFSLVGHHTIFNRALATLGDCQQSLSLVGLRPPSFATSRPRWRTVPLVQKPRGFSRRQRSGGTWGQFGA